MAKKHHGHKMHGHYEGHAGRRHQEMMDSGMISEDHSAVANMPQHHMMKEWPKAHDYMEGDLDDTIHGINRQMGEDASQRNRHEKPHKY